MAIRIRIVLLPDMSCQKGAKTMRDIQMACIANSNMLHSVRWTTMRDYHALESRPQPLLSSLATNEKQAATVFGSTSGRTKETLPARELDIWQ